MLFDRQVTQVGHGKSLCLSIPSVIIKAYKIKRKDIVTLEVFINGKAKEFTNAVYRSANLLRIAIPSATVKRNSITPGIYSFDFIKNLREGVKR